jgi:hypothetical protein
MSIYGEAGVHIVKGVPSHISQFSRRRVCVIWKLKNHRGTVASVSRLNNFDALTTPMTVNSHDSGAFLLSLPLPLLAVIYFSRTFALKM